MFAASTLSFALQYSHNGLADRKASLNLAHLYPYPLDAALPRASRGLCLAERLCAVTLPTVARLCCCNALAMCGLSTLQ